MGLGQVLSGAIIGIVLAVGIFLILFATGVISASSLSDERVEEICSSNGWIDPGNLNDECETNVMLCGNISSGYVNVGADNHTVTIHMNGADRLGAEYIPDEDEHPYLMRVYCMNTHTDRILLRGVIVDSTTGNVVYKGEEVSPSIPNEAYWHYFSLVPVIGEETLLIKDHTYVLYVQGPDDNNCSSSIPWEVGSGADGSNSGKKQVYDCSTEDYGASEEYNEAVPHIQLLNYECV